MIECTIQNLHEIITRRYNTYLLLCQVGQEEWRIDMVGIYQIGPMWKAAAVKADEIKIGSHESILYQHNTASH